jgi:hypothetical protein
MLNVTLKGCSGLELHKLCDVLCFFLNRCHCKDIVETWMHMHLHMHVTQGMKADMSMALGSSVLMTFWTCHRVKCVLFQNILFSSGILIALKQYTVLLTVFVDRW